MFIFTKDYEMSNGRKFNRLTLAKPVKETHTDIDVMIDNEQWTLPIDDFMECAKPVKQYVEKLERKLQYIRAHSSI